MIRLFFALGSVLAGLAVAVGAWSAHSSALNEIQALWLEKAVRYQIIHALALLATSLLMASHATPSKTAVAAGVSFLGGCLCFCGSLYVMAFSSIDAGLVTPAGGMLFLLGWACLACCAPKSR